MRNSGLAAAVGVATDAEAVDADLQLLRHRVVAKPDVLDIPAADRQTQCSESGRQSDVKVA
jgi:hypothetical protein